MTTTDPTERALLKAILLNPDDDTPRLVYADWLEERDTVSVPCPQCIGTGSHALNPYELAQRYGTHRAGVILAAARCGICHGTGNVPDTANADRAEFIRVQCELAQVSLFEDDYGKCYYCGGDGDTGDYHASRRCRVCDGTGKEKHKKYKRVKDLLARESALDAANRERWLRVECPKCGSSGNRDMYDDVGDLRATVRCQWCDGTGDIGGLSYHRTGDVGVAFARGFPDTINGCQLPNVFERIHDGSPDGGEWVPTPWIARVFAHHPTIRRVPLVDRVPYGHDSAAEVLGVGWQRASTHERMHPGADGSERHRYAIPDPVFDALKGTTSPHRTPENKNYPSHAAANEDLAVAVVTVARAHLANGAT